MWYTPITARGMNQQATYHSSRSSVIVDLMFAIDGQINHENHSQYVEKWRRAMTEAYELADKKSNVMTDFNEVHYCYLVIEFVYVI